MSDTFNAEEALEIACQIERNGAAFYREAANMVELSDSRELLLELATMEDGHEVVFEKMKEDIDAFEQVLADPDNMANSYLQAIAANHVFVANKKASDVFSKQSGVMEVLRTALQAEFASIAYFQGLKGSMAPSFDSSKLTDVIMEEQEHVVIINKKIINYAANKK